MSIAGLGSVSGCSVRALFPALAAVLFYEPASAQCPRWSSAFASSGLSNNVYAMAVFDTDAGGPAAPALYVAGEFSTAGTVRANNIARWDGMSWSALGAGVTGGEVPHVAALAVFDDGSGPALYAGGAFTAAGSANAKNIAKWNGSSWSALGAGTDGWVSALTVYDDASGGGVMLYAGGLFKTAGGTPTAHIARWNGVLWGGVGGGIDGPVAALTLQSVAAVDGDEPPELSNTGVLYAGGAFAQAGATSAQNVARWTGSVWTALGSGTNDAVSALHYVDSAAAGGPGLFAGGRFTACGAVSASRIAKWNGSTWSALGSGLAGGGRPTSVRALLLYDDGSGPALYVGGRFTAAGGSGANHIARWNGGTWSSLSTGVNAVVRALAGWTAPGGGASALYAAGQFTSAQSNGANRIAKWSGAAWSPLSIGQGLSGVTRALAVYDQDGGGPQPPALFAGGEFKSAGGVPAQSIARWTGSGWTGLSSGLNGTVHALAVHDDGLGGVLYAAGEFTVAGGVAANRIARWNGSTWSALGSGLDDTVYALAIHDSGSGPGLYAGGIFSSAGGVSANSVARWNGASWSALGGGVNDEVRALATFDDGSGPALYAAGDFTRAGGVRASNIARWNGNTWSNLGLGTNAPVYVLRVFDDGSGAALYVGGVFSGVNATAADKIARWNGVAWNALTTGTIGSLVQGANLQSSVEGIYAMTVFDDDGPGSNAPALIAGGDFVSADGNVVNHLAKWNGTHWSALASGLDEVVLCLAVHDDGTSMGSALFAGGRFTHTRDAGTEKPSSRIGKWSCP